VHGAYRTGNLLIDDDRISAVLDWELQAIGDPMYDVAYVLSDLTIDYAQRVVSLAGRQIQLTATEYRLLFELSVNAGRVLTHDQLLRRVWGPRKSGDIRALRTHLRRLRQKLGEDGNNPTWIFAEPRVGYRMPKAEGSDNAPPESGG